MKGIMYIMYDPKDPYDKLSQYKLYKTRSAAQGQATRFNGYFPKGVAGTYVVRQVELKLI